MPLQLRPMVRITPTDGAQVVRDMIFDLPSQRGPIKIEFGYAPERDDFLTVNRDQDPLYWGVRWHTTWTFEIGDNTDSGSDLTDHDVLVETVNAILAAQLVEASIDGGQTWRAVYLEDIPDVVPADKWNAGFLFVLVLIAKSLDPSIPSASSGTL